MMMFAFIKYHRGVYNVFHEKYVETLIKKSCLQNLVSINNIIYTWPFRGIDMRCVAVISRCLLIS